MNEHNADGSCMSYHAGLVMFQQGTTILSPVSRLRKTKDESVVTWTLGDNGDDWSSLVHIDRFQQEHSERPSNHGSAEVSTRLTRMVDDNDIARSNDRLHDTNRSHGIEYSTTRVSYHGRV